MISFIDYLRKKAKDPLIGKSLRYGNYCGPGPRFDKPDCETLLGGTPLPNPINDVDAACQKHDIAYCKCNSRWVSGLPMGGTPCTLDADRALILAVNDLLQSGTLSKTERFVADIIRSYFGFTTGLHPFTHLKHAFPKRKTD